MLKSRARLLISLSYGRRRVKGLWSVCPEHRIVYPPKELDELAPCHSPYCWDVIVWIGLKRQDEHKQLAEIRNELCSQFGLTIPIRTIGVLANRFLEYWTAVHLGSADKIRKLLERQGAYQILIDGTHETGSNPLLVAKDAISGIRLMAARITSEDKENIEPLLREISQSFGDPAALTKDMGKGITSAVEYGFKETHVIVCHFHFLRVVGNRLLRKQYLTFQKRIDRKGIKGELRALEKKLTRIREKDSRQERILKIVHRILSYESEGEATGIPFDLPTLVFCRRCLETIPIVHRWVQQGANQNKQDIAACELENILNELKAPPAINGRIHKEYERLKNRKKWFDSIRKALRYKNGPVPLSTLLKYSDKELDSTRKGIKGILRKLDREVENSSSSQKDPSLRKVLRGLRTLIAENEAHLLAPNVSVGKGKQTRIIKLERTNNSLEQDFRRIRRHFRRLQGNARVEESVQNEGVGTVLALNLENEGYMKTVYGGRVNIAKRFGEVSKPALILARNLESPDNSTGNRTLLQ